MADGSPKHVEVCSFRAVQPPACHEQAQHVSPTSLQRLPSDIGTPLADLWRMDSKDGSDKSG